MFIHFDRIHERDRNADRQTDGQTPHDGTIGRVYAQHRAAIQEAQLSLTNGATLFCKVVEVHKDFQLQDFLSENVDKKFTTDYNVA